MLSLFFTFEDVRYFKYPMRLVTIIFGEFVICSRVSIRVVFSSGEIARAWLVKKSSIGKR